MFQDSSISLFAREALMQQLSDYQLNEIAEGDDLDQGYLAGRILKYRTARRKYGVTSHRLNYSIEEVLDDYVNRRKGKRVEAKRQLRKRFDGQDHDMQERIMLTFMEQGDLCERDFVYGKLYGDDFWVDAYIPLVEAWWEQFHDHKMAKVVIKRCPRPYLLKHLEELKDHGSYATLCIRTGLAPDPARLSPQTYLYVLKSIGGQLRFREGERTVLKAVRDYLYGHVGDWKADTIYAVPHVRRMMAYLGEMGISDDILAIDAFDRRMSAVPRREWPNSVIKAIEEEFDFPEYVFKEVK